MHLKSNWTAQDKLEKGPQSSQIVVEALALIFWALDGIGPKPSEKILKLPGMSKPVLAHSKIQDKGMGKYFSSYTAVCTFGELV